MAENASKMSEVRMAQAAAEKLVEDEMVEMLGWEPEKFDRVRRGEGVSREEVDELAAFVKFIAMLGRLGGLLSNDVRPTMPVV